MTFLADPAKRRNLLERAISAVVLLPIAIWLTVVGGWPFAILVAVTESFPESSPQSMVAW